MAKKSKNIKEAEKVKVHIVDEAFLEDCKKGGVALMVTQHSIATWGDDVSEIIGMDVVSSCAQQSIVSEE